MKRQVYEKPCRLNIGISGQNITQRYGNSFVLEGTSKQNMQNATII